MFRGRDGRGWWIDPGTLQPLPTCPECDGIYMNHRCSLLDGCIKKQKPLDRSQVLKLIYGK